MNYTSVRRLDNRAGARLSPAAARPVAQERRAWSVERGTSCRAFTMIEIAISLAVIGFALAAIIGILPTGMNVTQANREETIVAQDASVFMNGIRYGEQGLDDLTNYVVSITRYWFDMPSGSLKPNKLHTSIYTYSNNTLDGTPVAPPILLNSGYHIVGLLSSPRWAEYTLTNGQSGYYSYYVTASVRSVSGLASEKYPQDNPTVQELALNYRLIPEIVPRPMYPPGQLILPPPAGSTTPTMFYPVPYPTDWTNWTYYFNSNSPAIGLSDWQSRSNFFKFSQTFQTNLADVRLIFRWPLINGSVGNNRQVFRTQSGGHFSTVYEYWALQPPDQRAPNGALYFFQPRLYVKGG